MLKKSAVLLALCSFLASPAWAQFDFGGTSGNFGWGPNGPQGGVDLGFGNINFGNGGFGFRGNNRDINGNSGYGRETRETGRQARQGWTPGGNPRLPQTQTTQYGVGPGITTHIRQLPPTMLDSFVRNSTNPEKIFGDEGTTGPPPDNDGFNYDNTIGSGLPGSQTMLSTGHASVLPSAWLDTDGFSGGMVGRNAGMDYLSGTGFSDLGDFSGFAGPAGVFGRGDSGAMGRPDQGLWGRAPMGPQGPVVPEGPASHGGGGERVPFPGMGSPGGGGGMPYPGM